MFTEVLDELREVELELEHLSKQRNGTLCGREIDVEQLGGRKISTDYSDKGEFCYYVSFAVCGKDGTLLRVDGGLFFMEEKVLGRKGMWRLDQLVTGLVEHEPGEIVRLVSWHLLEE
jgi:hypothetical protein